MSVSEAEPAAPTLHSPMRMCGVECGNRIVMAPMGRLRAPGGVPTSLMAEYYHQRAGAGMIIGEATEVSERGRGYDNCPGLHTLAQIEGWRQVTEAVHAAGSHICAQLFHTGRVSHSHFHNGQLPLAPSPIRPSGTVNVLRPQREYEVPREATLKDIDQVVMDFKAAAANALRAGFDGIDIHAANGYLIDQFLQDSTNKRTDEYGGSIENRCRLLWRIFDACVQVWGDSRKIGIHLAPAGDLHQMGDSDPVALFSHVVAEASRRRAGFIFCRIPLERQREFAVPLRRANGIGDQAPVFILNQDLTADLGQAYLREGLADACAWAKLYVSNPDLPKRFKLNAKLAQPNVALLYGGGAEGYIDYPTLAA